jgi:hypothetical protein
MYLAGMLLDIFIELPEKGNTWIRDIAACAGVYDSPIFI